MKTMCNRKGSSPPEATATTSPDERRLRVVLLSDELDVQREIAAERARSVVTKASFLVVIAGLLASTAFDTSPDLPWWGLSVVPLVLALGAVIAATAALWPAPAANMDPKAIHAKWVDSKDGAYHLEVYLLQAKVIAYAEMQKVTDARVRALKIGFYCLSFAVGSALVVFVVQRLS